MSHPDPTRDHYLEDTVGDYAVPYVRLFCTDCGVYTLHEHGRCMRWRSHRYEEKREEVGHE